MHIIIRLSNVLFKFADFAKLILSRKHGADRCLENGEEDRA